MMSASEIRRLCGRVKDASRRLALVETRTKNNALKAMGKALVEHSGYIIKENAKDLARARAKGLSSAMTDRLSLNHSRIAGMASSLSEIAALKDPVGEVMEKRIRPNGLSIKKIRVPIGVILIIYESRPNVTSDCIGLCLKSSNAVILRGGSEAINSNIAVFDILKRVAVKSGLPEHSIAMITDTDRRIVNELLRQAVSIDLVIPRGGESLIREVTERSRIPVIKHYKGVCHTFVDSGADLKMAEEICFNAKVQRPSACNAMETMLVHRDEAAAFLPKMVKRFKDAGVEIRGCAQTRRIVSGVKKMTENGWYAEYLDLILSVKVVKDIDAAIRHIMKYGSYHSDSIITRDKARAHKFLSEVDSACVFVNASTRFTDGGQFGKGAEMGISTDKLHARGPMGLEELTSYKYVVVGNGQIRK